MTEAEEKKLEAARKDAEEKDRKDAEEKERQDKGRRDSEEIPAWADSAFKKFGDSIMDSVTKAMDSRFDAFKKDAEKPEVAADKARKDAEEKEAKDRKDAEEKAEKDRKDAEEKEREDRARKDMQASTDNRQLRSQIAEMEKRLNNVYVEPSFEDRNALAEARSRADSVYQALTGQSCSMPLPGEPPLSYRKRLADGLRKFSDKFKNERLDSLSGAVYDEIEASIYADAQAAMRSPAVTRAGTLRAITTTEMGQEITRYIGDERAAIAPFEFGAVQEAAITRPSR